MRGISRWSGLSVGVLLLAGSLARAGIVEQGIVDFTEPQSGFYQGTKVFIVYTSDDPGNPAPGPAGSFTYVYTLANNPGCPGIICISLHSLETTAAGCLATGYIDDGDPFTPPPASVTPCGEPGDLVTWEWDAATGLVAPGRISDQLFVVSTLDPGTVDYAVVGFDSVFTQQDYEAQGACVGPVAPAPPLAIDIKPGSDPNTINVWGQGVVPVAILGSETVDVQDVDFASLLFEGASPVHDRGHLEDVDGDGFTDLVTHYRTSETDIEFGDTEACLEGDLDGTPLTACDTIRTVRRRSCGLGVELALLLAPLGWLTRRRGGR